MNIDSSIKPDQKREAVLEIQRQKNKHIFRLLAVSYIANIAKYFYDPLHYVSYVCFGLIFILMFPQYNRHRKSTKWFYVLLSYLTFLVIRGGLSGNFSNYLFYDITIYTSLIFLTYFPDNSNHDTYVHLPNLFAKLLLLSISFVLIIFFYFGNLENVALRNLLGVDNALVDDSWLIGPLIIAPFVVPFVDEMKRGYKYVVLMANLLLLSYGVLTATRTYVVICMIAFLSLFSFKRIISKKVILTALAIISIGSRR